MQASYNYMKRLKGVKIDYSRVAYAGFSRWFHCTMASLNCIIS